MATSRVSLYFPYKACLEVADEEIASDLISDILHISYSGLDSKLKRVSESGNLSLVFVVIVWCIPLFTAECCGIAPKISGKLPWQDQGMSMFSICVLVPLCDI